MVDPAEIFARVEIPSAKIREEALAYHDRLTKPAGSLGKLEEIGVWLCACQGVVPPRPISRARVVVFAGDHGVANNGVSAYPREVSLQMAANIRAGGAGINALAESAGATVRVADISLDHDAWGDERVSRSCGSIDVEDAMSEEDVIRALNIGKMIADQEVDSGADLLIAGDLGIGNTTPAAVLTGLATRNEPVAVVGRGTGIDDEAWKRKVTAVRDAMFRARNYRDDPVKVLQTVSSPDLTAMAGFLAQAAVRRTPVILDGAVVTSAALWATRLAPGARYWWLAGHQSVEPAHAQALELLELEPLLQYHMRLGEGSGAATALPLIRAAADVMINMATFESAGVSESV
ncbi:nicotinate-nucleotide--dimethylbenzimidazole phosphoribosyltransferase [Staphylococcus chromogenes]|nr:nicotinate-nucleotide--dimethylbenzimidazole phosphoribosyltransferase [Staphylococcus chromogenes]